MNDKTTRRCTEIVTRSLAPGERIELVEFAQIGKVSAKKQLGVAAVAGIASGGMLVVAVRPRAYFLVLTDQRILLIDSPQAAVGRGIGKVVATMPRTAITPTGPLRARLLTFTLDVTIDGTPSRLSWGRIQGSAARRVAEALHAPAAG